MNIEQAIDTIYRGLVSEKSIPNLLVTEKRLNTEMLDEVMQALDFAIEYYCGKSTVPKKIAIAMVDIQSAFFFKSGFEKEMLMKLEDIGIALQEKALTLFSEYYVGGFMPIPVLKRTIIIADGTVLVSRFAADCFKRRNEV